MKKLWKDPKEGHCRNNRQNCIPCYQKGLEVKGFPVPHEEFEAKDACDINKCCIDSQGPVPTHPDPPFGQVKVFPLVCFHVGGFNEFNMAELFHHSITKIYV